MRELTNQWKWSLVILGFLFLFFASFFDNLRGPLLPLIQGSMGVNVSASSLLIVVGNVTSIFATLALIRILSLCKAFSLMMIMVGLGIAVCVAALAVDTLIGLSFLGACLGIVIAGKGALCNVLVMSGSPVAYRSRMMAALHTFYGVGSMCAALYVSDVAARVGDWRLALAIMAGPLVALMIALVLMRNRLNIVLGAAQSRIQYNPHLFIVVSSFVLYVAGEVAISAWMVTYLTRQMQIDFSTAGYFLSAFFAVIIVMRLSTSLWMRMEWERQVLAGCVFLAAVFMVLGIFLKVPYFFIAAGVLGPFFPLYMSRLTLWFPDNWQSMSVMLVALMQLGLALMHRLLGAIFDAGLNEVAYLVPVICLLLSFVGTFGLLKKEAASRC